MNIHSDDLVRFIFQPRKWSGAPLGAGDSLRSMLMAPVMQKAKVALDLHALSIGIASILVTLIRRWELTRCGHI